MEICETEGFANDDQKRARVRVLALRLSAEAAERARQRALDRAKRKGQAVRAQTVFLGIFRK